MAHASSVYRFERREGWARVDFYDRPAIQGARLEALGELQDLYDELDRCDFPVVLLAFPSRTLESKLVTAVREAERRLSLDPNGEPLLLLQREENGLLEFVRRVRRLPSLVLCTLAGEIDFSFLGLALACDFRIAADDARFVNQWLRAGEPPLGAAVWFLSRYLGIGRATSLLVDGPALTAQDARRLGLVQRCVAAGDLLGTGEEVARRFARMPRGALAAMKRALVAATGDLEPYLELESQLLERALRSAASFEKRGEPDEDLRR